MFELILPIVLISLAMYIFYVVVKTIIEYRTLKEIKELEKKHNPSYSECTNSLYVEDGTVKSKKYKNMSYYKRLKRMSKEEK